MERDGSLMGRSSLYPRFKAARLEIARAEAKRINEKLPPRVYAFATPSGRVYVRYEPVSGKKMILRAEVGTQAFYGELAQAMSGKTTVVSTVPNKNQINKSDPKTWRWLCQQFFKSSKFLEYSARDQRVRRNVLTRSWDEPLIAGNPNGLRFGDMPMLKFRFRAISTLKERFAKLRVTPEAMYPEDRGKDRQRPETPEAGNSLVRYSRAVLEWTKEFDSDLIGGHNWGHDVNLYPSSVTGWMTWGPEQCGAFEAAHARGTKARLLYDLARLTGQRKGDIARLGPAMIEWDRRGREHLKFIQAKGRNVQPVTAYVPITPPLKQSLDAARAADLLGIDTFMAQENGKPYTAESLGNLFGDFCKQAGLAGYSMHGLRKTAVVNLIMADCSFFEIMSITGHRSKREIERYGREYMRAVAMESAFDKWLARHETEAALSNIETQAA